MAGELQAWGGSLLATPTGELAADPDCCCGYYCGVSDCPDSVLFDIQDCADEAGCGNCATYNDQFPIDSDPAYAGTGVCGSDTGYEAYPGVSCNVAASPFEANMRWWIVCNQYGTDPKHALNLDIWDRSIGGAARHEYFEYRFSDGDQLAGVVMSNTSPAASGNPIPCFRDAGGVYTATVTATATFP